MKNFLADWRNPVLLLAIIGTVGFGILWMNARQSSGLAITVGSQDITEKQIIHKLKASSGVDVVSNMVTAALIENHAQQLGVTASDAEIDQLVRFNRNRLEANAADLDDTLAEKGMTMADYREDLRPQVLQIKMLVKSDEMKAAAEKFSKAGTVPYVMPDRYKYRFFAFPSKDLAESLLGELKENTTEGNVSAAGYAMNSANANEIKFYLPGIMAKDPLLDTTLPKLKNGSCSQPIQIKGGWAVLQLVEKKPAEKPTFDEGYIMAGQMDMMSSPDKYAPRMQQLESEMLDTDIQFFMKDYDTVQKRFQDKKLSNVKMPDTSAQPGMPAMPSSPQ